MHEEQQYIDLIKKILQTGTKKDDRTGIGTYSVTGAQMRFSLSDNIFPLLTTKRVFFRGVLEELLFFVNGKTDNKLLVEKNVNIWTHNSTAKFFKKNNINRAEGDLGPVYGFQWRHFGADYVDCNTDYSGRGIDQLKNVIESIKKDPNSRRHIVSAWNPMQLNVMALPPCHLLFQFVVRGNLLDCILYQRSGDVGLGIPFNIASYSLLTIMVAHLCDLNPGEFIHFIGDAHVYINHVNALTEQIARAPTNFPTLKLARQITELEDFKYEDFVLSGYEPHPPIKMDMAV